MSGFKLPSNLLRDSGRRGASRPPRPAPARLALEALAGRVLPAVTATFSAADGTLRVVGDELDNTVVVSRDPAGTILVNGGAVAIQGGQATAANTRLIFLNGGAGNDNLSLSETNGAMPAAAIGGGDGNDALVGGSGNDLVSGGAGNDTAFLGTGDDTFVWNPGDGSDVVRGQGGSDTLVFNGSDVSEKFDVSADGDRVRFARDVAGVAMDLGGVEEIDLNALGGADTLTVGNQLATELNVVRLNLAGSAGGGDGQADAVIINGTDGPDFGLAATFDNGASVSASLGSFPVLSITGAEGATDSLTLNALGGNDTVNASGLFATNASQLIRLTVSGGAGNDALTGSPGADTFVWSPDDGSDAIDGGDGLDKLTFNGSDAAEAVVVARDGDHGRLTSDVGTVTLDLNAVDGIEVNALGGADTITVNDLTGTGIVKVQLNLNGSAGGGDGRADGVIVNATSGDDAVRLTGSVNGISVDGLFPLVRITGAEATDRLSVNALGGNDTVDASNLPAGLVRLTVDLGDGQAAPRVTGVAVNGGSAQRSKVTRVRVTFDRHLTLPANPADAFRLVRQSDAAAVLLGAVVDDTGAGTTVALTFTGGAVNGASLADGRYTLTVLAARVGDPSGALDGNGDGTGGDDFVLVGDPAANKLFRLFGDVNGDGAVNGLDLAAFRAAFGTSAPPESPFDFNGDGVVNGLDLAQFRRRFGTTV